MRNYKSNNSKQQVIMSSFICYASSFVIIYVCCFIYGSYIAIENVGLENIKPSIEHTKDVVETVVNNNIVYADINKPTDSDVSNIDDLANKISLERRGILLDFVDWLKSLFKPNDNVTSCHVTNQEVILLQPENHGILFYDNIMRNLSAEEINRINIMAHNYGSFEYNNLLLDSDNPEVVQEIFDFLQYMYNTEPTVASSHSELSSDLVRNIQNGGSITIYTSSSGSTLEHIYDQYQSTSVDSSSVVNLPVDSHTFSNEPTNPGHVNVETSNTSLNNLFDSITNNPRKVVIAVKPAGMQPSALPSWTEVTSAPPLDSPERLGWERNVAIVKYWTSKFEWMGDGFKSVTIDHNTVEWIQNIGSNLPDIEYNEADTPLPDQTEGELSDLNTEQHADRSVSIINDTDSLKMLERSQTIVRSTDKSNNGP